MKVKVVRGCVINGSARKPGATVEVTDGIARSLISTGQVSAINEKGAGKKTNDTSD